jgi:hypothetical protein
MKFYFSGLPEELRAVLATTSVVPRPADRLGSVALTVQTAGCRIMYVAGSTTCCG